MGEKDKCGDAKSKRTLSQSQGYKELVFIVCTEGTIEIESLFENKND